MKSINCLGVRATCILVVLLHDRCCNIFKLFDKDSYQIRRAHCLPWSSQLLFIPPMSVSRLHNLRLLFISPMSVSRLHNLRLLFIPPMSVSRLHNLRLVGRRNEFRTINSQVDIRHTSIEMCWLALLLTHFCMICLVGTMATGMLLYTFGLNFAG